METLLFLAICAAIFGSAGRLYTFRELYKLSGCKNRKELYEKLKG